MAHASLDMHAGNGTATAARPLLAGRVRPLVPADLDAIVHLNMLLFPGQKRPADLRAFLGAVFFEHPWKRDDVHSLGFESPDGELVGCLGVMPRPMSFLSEPILVAVSHNFMVHPTRRPSLAAVRLLRAFFAGPQELSLADPNAEGVRLSERFGAKRVGSISSWLRVLRPGGLVKHAAERRFGPTIIRALSPVAGLVDGALARLPETPLHVHEDAARGVPVSDDELARLLCGLSADYALRPLYDWASLSWLLDTLRATRKRQTLRVRRAVDAAGGSLGWFVYYVRVGGVARVLQIGARRGARGRVLAALFQDALAHGAVAVAGQVQPGWMDALAESQCILRPGTSWLTFHARDARVGAIRCTLERGDAFLSRLEGESWLHFAL